MSIVTNNQLMIDEIMQEPKLFSQILKNKTHYTEGFVNLLTSKNIKKIVFIGSGSPSHLSVSLKYAAIKLLKVEAIVELPSLFLYHNSFNVGNAYNPDEMLLICPVESGRTKGPYLAALQAKELGISVVCTTLDENGPLASVSDVVIKKPSGAELAPPSTKGHSTGILILLLCMIEAAMRKGTISAKEYENYQVGFSELPSNIEKAAKNTLDWFELHKEVVMNSKNYWFLAYGANYGTATEAVLKFLESHQKNTFAYELEEFLHGPLCAVNTDDVVFFLAAENGPEKDRLLLLYDTMKKSYPNCVLIQSNVNPIEDVLAITLNSVNLEFLNALEFLIPIQVSSYIIADNLGIDITIWTTKSIREVMKPSL